MSRRGVRKTASCRHLRLGFAPAARLRSRFGQAGGFLLLSGLSLAFGGCMSTQSRAREQAAERWNQVRAQVKVRLASDQLATGNVEGAASELAEAFRLAPADSELLTLQARVCLARGDLATAERVLESAQAEGGPRAESDYLLGVIHEQRLQWSLALECFLRASIADPHEVAYVVAIVQAMLQLGEAEDALGFLDAYEPQFGWTSAYHAARAECCEQLGNWAQAASAWQKVLDAHGDPGIRERLAMALYRAGRGSQAVRHFEQLLVEPGTVPAAPLRLALAECLLEEGRLAAADEQLSLVLRADPRDVTALRLKAQVFAERKQFQRAYQSAEQALRLAPHDVQVLELAAALAFRTGDRMRACSLARQALQSSPKGDSRVARRILEQVSAASAHP